MKTIEEHIQTVDKAICDNIEAVHKLSRGLVSQNILGQFRNLVEHIAVKIYAETHDGYIDYETIPNAVAYLKSNNEFYFLRKFHGLLQKSRSHYTPDNEGAERLLLKYYEYLLQIKDFMQRRYGMEILHNICDFPIDMDDTLQQYYEKIVDKLMIPRFADDYERKSERFYIQKSKAFFVNHHVYYENTLIPANDETSKFNRIVVFSKTKITTNYAIKVGMEDDIIEMSGKFMPVKILIDWTPSIRPCEINNFAKVLGMTTEITGKHAEYNGLMNYLAKSGLNLVDILELSNEKYTKIKEIISARARVFVLCEVLDKARGWIIDNKSGSNVIRYLLYCMNNKIIKLQFSDEENYRIKGLYIDNRAIPFDEMPYNSGLYNHNPSLLDLYECINSEGREHELLAHQIGVNADTYGRLYTKIEDLTNFDDISLLIEKYNNSLYKKHQNRRLEKLGNNIFVKGYEEDTKDIIQKLIDLTKGGVNNYKESVKEWMENNPKTIDCDDKKNIMLHMFDNSKIAMIYGAAGTGKSTLINHVSQFWQESSKVYLANTNPAVENLRRRVQANNCEFMTIKKYIYSSVYKKADILFIDECSMVNNRDMAKLLAQANFELLVLVGDIYQIESIQFGNWFSLARSFVPEKAQYELTKPYRTQNKALLSLWDKVRNYEDDIAECLVSYGYTTVLDESIFEPATDDEIILCLNYDGLYGINNINRFLQNANRSKGLTLGVWSYKIGDPVLFNDSSRYDAILYNNLKGKIVNIEEEDEEIFFSIEIDKVLNSIQVSGTDLELLPIAPSGKSVVRFPVKKRKAGDDDSDDKDIATNVPFQIAYAVSIHKAQGLEYNSVKIVITKEVDEMISHNIFYTAITRAKENLKIYWTPESQQKILTSFKDNETSYDAKIFAARTKMRIVNGKKKER